MAVFHVVSSRRVPQSSGSCVSHESSYTTGTLNFNIGGKGNNNLSCFSVFSYVPASFKNLFKKFCPFLDLRRRDWMQFGSIFMKVCDIYESL